MYTDSSCWLCWATAVLSCLCCLSIKCSLYVKLDIFAVVNFYLRIRTHTRRRLPNWTTNWRRSTATSSGRWPSFRSSAPHTSKGSQSWTNARNHNAANMSERWKSWRRISRHKLARSNETTKLTFVTWRWSSASTFLLSLSLTLWRRF